MARGNGGIMPGDLDDDHLDLIVRLYTEQEWTTDSLPYTEDFESMLRSLHAAGLDISRRDFARLLIRLRKLPESPLPKKGRKAGTDPIFDRGQDGLLIVLYDGQPTTLDFLAYTPHFDRLASDFRRQTFHSWTDMEIYHGLGNLRRYGRLPLKGHKKSDDRRPDLFGGVS